MKDRALNFFSQLFSNDETCVSTLVFIFIASVALSFFMVFRDGDIPNNLYNFNVWSGAFVMAQTVVTGKRIDSFDIYNKK